MKITKTLKAKKNWEKFFFFFNFLGFSVLVIFNSKLLKHWNQKKIGQKNFWKKNFGKKKFRQKNFWAKNFFGKKNLSKKLFQGSTIRVHKTGPLRQMDPVQKGGSTLSLFPFCFFLSYTVEHICSFLRVAGAWSFVNSARLHSPVTLSVSYLGFHFKKNLGGTAFWLV